MKVDQEKAQEIIDSLSAQLEEVQEELELALKDNQALRVIVRQYQSDREMVI